MVHEAPARTAKRHVAGPRLDRCERPEPHLAPDAHQSLEPARLPGTHRDRYRTSVLRVPPPGRPERTLGPVGQIHAVERGRKTNLEPRGRNGQRNLTVVLERQRPPPRPQPEPLSGRSRSVEVSVAPGLAAVDDRLRQHPGGSRTPGDPATLGS